MVADRIDDVDIKQEPDDDAVAVNRRSGTDALLGDARRGRHDDAMLTGSGRQMRKIMKALSRREGIDVYDSDEEAKNPYALDESDDEDLDVLHPERAILEAREERARAERAAREAASAGATPPPADGDASNKRKGDAGAPDAKRARVGDSRAGSPSSTHSRSGSPGRSSSPPRSLSPLETEIAQLIERGTVTSTADLVQHFRARLKQDSGLKEQLSAAVKRIALMDKKTNTLKLKEAFSHVAT